MLGSVAAWFATSRLGRALAAGGAIAFATAIAALKVFNAGKAAERARQTKASLDNMRKRQRTDAEIESLGGGDVDRRLDRWVRDDE